MWLMWSVYKMLSSTYKVLHCLQLTGYWFPVNFTNIIIKKILFHTYIKYALHGFGDTGCSDRTYFSSWSRYHIFCRRPFDHPAFIMKCEPERNNPYDLHAIVVPAPTMAGLPVTLRNLETRPGPRRQTVQHVAGQPLGRMPTTLCRYVFSWIDNGSILSAEAFYTGHITNDGPVRGAGPKSECAFVFT